MKNIQEIIKDMEKMSEQVAATESEAEKELTTLAGVAPAAVDPVLGTACCIVTVPNEFTLPATIPTTNIFPTANQNIIFSTADLACCVNPTTFTCTPPCGAPFEVNAFEVRVVGCIPFIANLFPITGSNTCEAVPGTTRICCSDTLCVNKVVGIYRTEAEARAACTGFDCTSVTVNLVSSLVSLCNGSAQGVQFAATFSTTIGNCTP